MRIAVSGAHGTGKSTLVGELARTLPTYIVVDEPFYALDAEGVVFAARPTARDFALMLQRSCAMAATHAGEDVLFDRCPVDHLAYLSVSRGHDPALLPRRLSRVARAMRRIDLVVYVPIEHPDRIAIGTGERPRLRRQVDQALREMLVENTWGLNPRVVEVSGPVKNRVEQVVAAMGA